MRSGCSAPTYIAACGCRKLCQTSDLRVRIYQSAGLAGCAASCWIVAIRLIYQLACQLFRWLALLPGQLRRKTSRSWCSGTSSPTAKAPTLSIVGFAVSASKTADAWATSTQVDALASEGNPLTSQMLYRFDSASAKEQILADRMKLASVVSGALLGTQSWLDTKRAADQGAAATVPFVMAFGVLGIVMSVIIVSSVISGAVGTSLRRIGILKAIGFTPREVVRAYVAQALIPACAGIAVGVVLGNLLAVPLLADTEAVYGTVSLSVAWWVDIAVPAATLVIVGLAALIPALRAGKLRTVEAIAVGRSPRTRRGQLAHRVMGPLPRPVTYGLATPFTHPVRTLAMLLAVAFGTVAATFAVGLTSSLGAVSASQDTDSRAAVTVTVTVTVTTIKPDTLAPPPPPPVGGSTASPSPVSSSVASTSKHKVADPAKVRSAIKAQAGTVSYYGKTQTEVAVAGVSGSVQISLYEGDSRSARCGLDRLVTEHVKLPGGRNGAGAAVGAKVTSIVGGMAAGGESINDLDILRHGAMPKVFTGLPTRCTAGSW